MFGKIGMCGIIKLWRKEEKGKNGPRNRLVKIHPETNNEHGPIGIENRFERNKSKMGDVNTNIDISLSRWIKVSPPRVTDQKLWLRIESAVGWIP